MRGCRGTLHEVRSRTRYIRQKVCFPEGMTEWNAHDCETRKSFCLRDELLHEVRLQDQCFHKKVCLAGGMTKLHGSSEFWVSCDLDHELFGRRAQLLHEIGLRT